MDAGRLRTEEKERIFYLVRPAGGGMRSHLQQLLSRFDRDYDLYLGVSPAGKWAEATGLSAASLFQLPLHGGVSPLGDLIVLRRLYRQLRALRPALLHIHGFKAVLPGLAAARLSRTPVLITVHNYPAHRAFPLLILAGRMAGAQKVHHIAVCNALAAELAASGIPPRQVSVIHNGIDPAPFEKAAAGRILLSKGPGHAVVGTAARFAPQKGLIYFLEAAAALAPIFPGLRFMIIGDGPGGPALEKLALRLGLSGRLSFCGYRTDLPRLLAGIDIFVLPSLTEGFPLTVLEAAAAGCALVATEVGGVPEVITGGVHGLLVPPADAPALARAIAVLAGNPEGARRLAGACRERVRTGFSLAQMLSQTAALYERLLGESAAGGPGGAEPVQAGEG